MRHVAESAKSTRWAVARWLALGAVPVLLGWFLLAPATALRIFWYVVIPLLPATFFVNPILWRGLCPLATLNALGNRLGTPHELTPRVTRTLNVAGLALFYLLVPARHLVFNHDGVALAATVAGIGALAVALGAVFPVRSAFCNALCPILPIELLYGTAPLRPMERNRCATCTVCVPRGCLDLAKQKAVPQRLGPVRRTARWLATPYGVFFAALPGFIIGFNHVSDGPWGAAGTVYATVLGWALGSFVVIAGLVAALRVASSLALTGLAAMSGMLYYWFAGATIAKQFAAPMWVADGCRIIGIGVVLVWLFQALPSSGAILPAADGRLG